MDSTRNRIIQPHDQAVHQRFEAKYLINEVQALAIKDFMVPYVAEDPLGPIYPVTSLYLDSADLKMYWSSELGEKNRYKLRIRSYNENPADPVYFEVKRRIGRVIFKNRAATSRACVPEFLYGGDLRPEWLTQPGDAAALANLAKFRDLMDGFQASPRLSVRYLREAYVSNLDEPLRVTFDRRLQCLPSTEYSPSLWSSQAAWRDVEAPQVVLEVKFTDAFPGWVKRMIQRFNLERISLAKYTVCVDAAAREGEFVGGVDGRTPQWT